MEHASHHVQLIFSDQPRSIWHNFKSINYYLLQIMKAFDPVNLLDLDKKWI